MSYSTLIGIDKNGCVEKTIEYKNSWLCSPIILDELFFKYMPESMQHGLGGGKMGIMTLSMFDKTLFPKLNDLLNNSKDMNDRIVWELANQQVFYKKDFKLLSNAIKIVADIYLDSKYGGHIKERFLELAKDIESLKSEFLVHKNTSCDDNVEVWFKNEEESMFCYTENYYGKIELVETEGNNMSFKLLEKSK